jgi:3-dehydroquinate dehydratase-1
VTVRGSIIGGPLPLVCLPLVGDTRARILEEARALVNLQPDLLEWRVDCYERLEDIADCLAVLKEIRTIIGDTALIFTCRTAAEGGVRALIREARLKLISQAITSGDIDIVDIELGNDRRFIDRVKELSREHGVRLILSYHNFTETPDEHFILVKLIEAQTTGADIAKFAAMPTSHRDVLCLFNATQKARSGSLQIPMAAISMGPMGAVSRIAGGLFGSDITFAVGVQASAPGQIPLEELRRGMELLYRS